MEQETGKTYFGKADTIPRNFLEGLISKPASAIPYAGELYDISQIAKLKGISDKAKGGTATPEDLAWAKDYVENAEEESRRQTEDWGYAPGSVIKGSLQFMGEILAAGIIAPPTGGGSIASLIATKGAMKAAKIVATKIVTDSAARALFTKEIGKFAIGAGIRVSIASSTKIPAGTVERMTGTPIFNDQGDFTGLAEDGQPLKEAAINSVSSALVEYSSEFTGGAFTLLGQGAKTALVKAGFMQAVIKANPSITPSIFRQVIQKAGWNGVLPEFGEERVADAMYAALHELGLSDQTFEISWKQVVDEIAAFSIMGVAVKGVDRALGRKTTSTEQEAKGGGQVPPDGGKGGQAPPGGDQAPKEGGGGAPEDQIDTLVADVRAQMDAGASPTEIAVALSQEMSTSAAQAIVKEAVFEAVKETTAQKVEVAPAETAIEQSKKAFADIEQKVDEAVLAQTPSEFMEQFNALQEKIDTDTKAIRE